jgi:MoxR-like ATPase
MPGKQEKIQRLLQNGVRTRPPGTRRRFGLYIDVSLVERAEELRIFKRKNGLDDGVSFSLWLERELVKAIQVKKSSQ